MSALPKPHFTPEEYLALEDEAEYRSEYIHGEIFAMAGTQTDHSRIHHSLIRAFGRRFEGRPCETFGSETRLQAAHGNVYTYPDLMALCGPPQFVTPKAEGIPHLLNPQVIIEILSASTAPYDRSKKFLGYQQIESVTDYVLVSAERMQAEQYTRYESGIWHYQAFSQPTDLLRFASVGCEIPLAEFYDKVDFEAFP